MFTLVVRFPHQNNQKKNACKEAQNPRETNQEEKHKPQSKKSPLLPPPHLTATLSLSSCCLTLSSSFPDQTGNSHFKYTHHNETRRELLQAGET
jgi:hypothetical protein